MPHVIRSSGYIIYPEEGMLWLFSIGNIQRTKIIAHRKTTRCFRLIVYHLTSIANLCDTSLNIIKNIAMFKP